MESFTIKTTMLQKDLETISLATVDRFRVFTLLLFMGYLQLIVGVFKLFGIVLFYLQGPFYQNLLAGSVFLFFIYYLRYSVKKAAKKAFSTNKKLQQEIEYCFDDDGIKLTGYNFESFCKWNEIPKLKVIKKLVVIYTSSNTMGMIIPTQQFTTAQLDFVISKVKHK